MVRQSSILSPAPLLVRHSALERRGLVGVRLRGQHNNMATITWGSNNFTLLMHHVKV